VPKESNLKILRRTVELDDIGSGDVLMIWTGIAGVKRESTATAISFFLLQTAKHIYH
jgi:hypothetical protein